MTVLIGQSDMIKYHTVTGGNHTHGGTVFHGGSSVRYYGDNGWYSTGSIGYSGNLTMTYGNSSTDIETRPYNFTYKIWVRTS